MEGWRNPRQQLALDRIPQKQREVVYLKNKFDDKRFKLLERAYEINQPAISSRLKDESQLLSSREYDKNTSPRDRFSILLMRSLV